jgi:hypothetical protein
MPDRDPSNTDRLVETIRAIAATDGPAAFMGGNGNAMDLARHSIAVAERTAVIVEGLRNALDRDRDDFRSHIITCNETAKTLARLVADRSEEVDRRFNEMAENINRVARDIAKINTLLWSVAGAVICGLAGLCVMFIMHAQGHA